MNVGLDAKEIKSSSKIDLKDVSWWMFVKDAYKFVVLIIVRLLKERCISLTVGGKPSHATHKRD
jgi:hypothetical protein